jgi:hypothetical protein
MQLQWINRQMYVFLFLFGNYATIITQQGLLNFNHHGKMHELHKICVLSLWPRLILKVQRKSILTFELSGSSSIYVSALFSLKYFVTHLKFKCDFYSTRLRKN